MKNIYIDVLRGELENHYTDTFRCNSAYDVAKTIKRAYREKEDRVVCVTVRYPNGRWVEMTG